MKKFTVTIGIPAYNEEANIGYLLQDIKNQELDGFIIDKIIVISDGSTDNTAGIVKKFNDSRVVLISNKTRKGLAKAENEIFNKSKADAVILLNADIELTETKFISELIKPILEKKADLTCIRMEELDEANFMGKVLNTSMKFKTSVFENYKNGDNIYTCHGTARGFSRKLYKSIKFKDSVGEDAYSYLFSKFNKFKYKYVKSVKGYYKVPSNFKDHEKQSIRFIQSQEKFNSEFGKEFVKKNYQLPIPLLIRELIRTFLSNPIYISAYIFIFTELKIKSLFYPKINDTWEISVSSKVLR